jgi:hypothetical protein
MIAYCFPPVGGATVAGSQRALKFCKYLEVLNWGVYVLTLKEGFYEDYYFIDDDLKKEIPPGTKVHRTKKINPKLVFFEKFKQIVKGFILKGDTNVRNKTNSGIQNIRENYGKIDKLKDAINQLLEIPDNNNLWIPYAYYEGCRIIKQKNVDLIYATGKPWSSLIIGMLLKKKTGKPLIVDFRDPWVTNPFKPKYTLLREKIDLFLEKKIIKESALVICNTTELANEFKRRYKFEKREKFFTLLNGFDPDELKEKETEGFPEVKNGKMTIIHTGTLYRMRDPKNLLKAVSNAINSNKIKRTDIHIKFVGMINVDYDLKKFISNMDLDDIILLRKGVSLATCKEIQQSADILLLLQPATKTQIPSKLFDYVVCNKVVFSVAVSNSEVSSIIEKMQIGITADCENIDDIEKGFVQLYEKWKAQDLGSLNKRNGNEMQKYNISKSIKKLDERIDKILS